MGTQHPSIGASELEVMKLLWERGPATGLELWRSDGTSDGTMLVKDILRGVDSSSAPEMLQVVNGTLFFSAQLSVVGRELWNSDGTAAFFRAASAACC